MGTVIGSETEGFCANTANVMQVIGYALLVFKIVIPILLIIWGMMDLGRAVVAAKDDEIKKATKQLGLRAVAAVIIFFLPTIVGLVIGLIGNFQDIKDDYNVCRSCIVNPNGDDCVTKADAAWNK